MKNDLPGASESQSVDSGSTGSLKDLKTAETDEIVVMLRANDLLEGTGHVGCQAYICPRWYKHFHCFGANTRVVIVLNDRQQGTTYFFVRSKWAQAFERLQTHRSVRILGSTLEKHLADLRSVLAPEYLN